MHLASGPQAEDVSKSVRGSSEERERLVRQLEQLAAELEAQKAASAAVQAAQDAQLAAQAAKLGGDLRAARAQQADAQAVLEKQAAQVIAREEEGLGEPALGAGQGSGY